MGWNHRSRCGALGADDVRVQHSRHAGYNRRYRGELQLLRADRFRLHGEAGYLRAGRRDRFPGRTGKQSVFGRSAGFAPMADCNGEFGLWLCSLPEPLRYEPGHVVRHGLCGAHAAGEPESHAKPHQGHSPVHGHGQAECEPAQPGWWLLEHARRRQPRKVLRRGAARAGYFRGWLEPPDYLGKPAALRRRPRPERERVDARSRVGLGPNAGGCGRQHRLGHPMFRRVRQHRVGHLRRRQHRVGHRQR